MSLSASPRKEEENKQLLYALTSTANGPLNKLWISFFGLCVLTSAAQQKDWYKICQQRKQRKSLSRVKQQRGIEAALGTLRVRFGHECGKAVFYRPLN